jgi:hypothetical protein
MIETLLLCNQHRRLLDDPLPRMMTAEVAAAYGAVIAGDTRWLTG